MAKESAGILLYRIRNRDLQVFLVHPGGPFWAKKDAGSWSIPKGEFSSGEDPLATAQREFQEETGSTVSGHFVALTPLKQPSGKIVHAWALQGDCDHQNIQSNSFSMEWPPRSGKMQEFPEVDRAGWFKVEEAKTKILKGQIGFLEALQSLVSGPVELRTGHGHRSVR